MWLESADSGITERLLVHKTRVKVTERLLVHKRMQTSALLIRDLDLLELGITRLDSESMVYIPRAT